MGINSAQPSVPNWNTDGLGNKNEVGNHKKADKDKDNNLTVTEAEAYFRSLSNKPNAKDQFVTILVKRLNIVEDREIFIGSIKNNEMRTLLENKSKIFYPTTNQPSDSEILDDKESSVSIDGDIKYLNSQRKQNTGYFPIKEESIEAKAALNLNTEDGAKHTFSVNYENSTKNLADQNSTYRDTLGNSTNDHDIAISNIKQEMKAAGIGYEYASVKNSNGAVGVIKAEVGYKSNTSDMDVKNIESVKGLENSSFTSTTQFVFLNLKGEIGQEEGMKLGLDLNGAQAIDQSNNNKQESTIETNINKYKPNSATGLVTPGSNIEDVLQKNAEKQASIIIKGHVCYIYRAPYLDIAPFFEVGAAIVSRDNKFDSSTNGTLTPIVNASLQTVLHTSANEKYVYFIALDTKFSSDLKILEGITGANIKEDKIYFSSELGVKIQNKLTGVLKLLLKYEMMLQERNAYIQTYSNQTDSNKIQTDFKQNAQQNIGVGLSIDSPGNTKVNINLKTPLGDRFGKDGQIDVGLSKRF